MEIFLLIFVLSLALIALNVPIVFVFFSFGFLGLVIESGEIGQGLLIIKNIIFDALANPSIIVIGLYILLGSLFFHSGFSQKLFDFIYVFFARRRSSIIYGTLVFSGVFSLISGSSTASAGAILKVVKQPFEKYNLDERLIVTIVCAGGALGVLIPPSIVLIVMSILIEENLVTLFKAALVPGLLAFVSYLFLIYWQQRFDSSASGSSASGSDATGGVSLNRASYDDGKSLLRSFIDVLPVLVLIFCISLGLFWDLLTPIQAACFGIVYIFVSIFIINISGAGRLSDILSAVANDTGKLTANIFLFLFGAFIFKTYLGYLGVNTFMSDLVLDMSGSPYLVLISLLVIYLLLGCFFDTLSILFFTIPILYPALQHLSFGMSVTEFNAWFSILVLITVELGLITPPIGLNLFIIHKQYPSLSMVAIYRSVLPLIFFEIGRLVLLLLFPGITFLLI